MKKFKLISILSLLFVLNVASMCSDDDDTSTQVSNPTEITSTLTDGQWIVTLFKEADVDNTSDFSGYTFGFGSDGALSATNGSITQSGDWSTYTDSGYTKFDMMFTALDGPFESISEDWRVISRTTTKVELKHISGGDGSVDLLTFEKD